MEYGIHTAIQVGKRWPSHLGLLIFLLLGMSMGTSHGQAFSIVANCGTYTASGNDGGFPNGGLVLGVDGNFYGETGVQYINVNGTYQYSPGGLFRISPAGGETVLASFTNYPSTGYQPVGGLFPGTDGKLYGVFGSGGASYGGGLFSYSTADGTLSTVTSFSSSITGGNPHGPVAEGSDGSVYTTAQYISTQVNGTYVYHPGTLVKVLSNGQPAILHTFGDGSVSKDGAQPNGGLVLGADGAIYGTTSYTENSGLGEGIAFKVTPQGQYTVLHNFGDGTVTNDGETPLAGFVQSTDGNFYGTSSLGGSNGSGTIFKMTPQGQVTILHSFGDGTVQNDGTTPMAALLLGSDGNFYGTTSAGGSANLGTVFEITPQGRYAILHNFGDGSLPYDGAQPEAALVQAQNGTLYGTTILGGTANKGTVFEIVPSLPALSSNPGVVGTSGLPFTYTVRATQGTTSFVADVLPLGVTLDPGTGLITGTPTTAGTTVTTLTLTNGSGSSTAQVTFTILALPAPVIGGFLNAYGSVGRSFTYQINASNAPSGYTVTGLPANLTYNATTGVISGTPNVSGTSQVTLTASNGTGSSPIATLTLQVFSGAPSLSSEYQVLHRFNDGSVTNDAEYPTTIFQGFDGNFYGASQPGGVDTAGSVFKISSQGTSSVLVSLGSAGASSNPSPPRSSASLVQGCDGNFYGTTEAIGSSNDGYIYVVNALGEARLLHHFGDGSIPNDGLIPNTGLFQAADGNFYGTTEFGGAAGQGCIFQLTPAGAVTIMHSFGNGATPNDGQYPLGGLAQDSAGNFYGTTYGGGTPTVNGGTLFKMTPQGVVTILHNFNDGSVTNDGNEPGPTLFLGDDGNLYGVTEAGGSLESGCVFRATTAGAVTILHSFGDGSVANDGDTPIGPLIEGFNTNFYGTTALGGSAGEGTVFSITKAGVVTILHSFGDGNVANDGSYPTSISQGIDGNFYGTTEAGGSGDGFGTVFAILAGQTPVLPPIFTGATYEAGEVGQPFVFIPKALFGSSIDPTGVGTMAVHPSVVRPDFQGTGVTFWTSNPIPPPPGNFSFLSTSGKFLGVPTDAGTFPFLITPYNNLGAGSSQNITFYLDVPPPISSPSAATGSVNTLFSYPIAVQSDYPFKSIFGLTNFPGWLSIVNGVVSGTPPSPGVYTFTVSASNLLVSTPSTKTVTLTVTGGSANLPSISSSTAIRATAGTALSYSILASNNPTAFSVLALPPGLVCNQTTGVISGIPTTGGTFPVPVTVTNSTGASGAEITFTVAAPQPPSLPGQLTAVAGLNQPYSFQIPATGLVTLYGAYLVSDSTSLPPGLILDNMSGVISGNPTMTGTYNLVLLASNDLGTATSSLTLVVGTPLNFSSWENQFGLTNAPLSTTTQNDGVPIGFKFLFNISPNHTMTLNDQAALPVVTSDATATQAPTYLGVTYRQAALSIGMPINFQTSSDLKTWTTVTPDINRQVGTDPVTGDPMIEKGVYTTNGTRMFIRLNTSSN